MREQRALGRFQWVLKLAGEHRDHGQEPLFPVPAGPWLGRCLAFLEDSPWLGGDPGNYSYSSSSRVQPREALGVRCR